MIDRADWDRITAPLPQAWTLPPGAYTSAEIFALEKERLFQADWVCLAREEQLPLAGDYLCVDLLGQPLVLVRRKDGSIHGMSTVCLHRGMPVATGQGNARHFSCPYHLWKYDLEGQLISAPMMEGVEDFVPAQCRLPEVAVEVWQGFVFVNLDTDAAPLTPELEGLTKILADYGLDRLVSAGVVDFDSPWNWKLLLENFMEAYHHIGPHIATFQPNFPARDARVIAADNHRWSVLHMPGLNADPDAALPDLPGLSGDQLKDLLAIVVSPGLIFAVNNHLAAWYQISLHNERSMQLTIHLLLPPEVVGDESMAPVIEATLAGTRYIHEEDIPVNAGPWAGMNAPLTSAGRLSLHEKAIWHLNQWWAQKMNLFSDD
ncbi:MAG: aromatic ring-hydroxylating dioxygenase subunit alpha [Pseudomonadales bacterium]|nr:aromatic ring-hydroxylating dioxygenase subunit alpha [Pseudomonadales bacterium]